MAAACAGVVCQCGHAVVCITVCIGGLRKNSTVHLLVPSAAFSVLPAAGQVLYCLLLIRCCSRCARWQAGCNAAAVLGCGVLGWALGYGHDKLAVGCVCWAAKTAVGRLWCVRPCVVVTGGVRAPCGARVAFECSHVVMLLAMWGVSSCFGSCAPE